MNEINHIPLDKILMMSFKAFDDGDKDLANQLFSSFETAKNKALELAEKAVEAGDTQTVDIIINSFNKAKTISEERQQKANVSHLETQSEEISLQSSEKNSINLVAGKTPKAKGKKSIIQEKS